MTEARASSAAAPGRAAAGEAPQPAATTCSPGSHPCYRVYACAYCRAMALGALEPKFGERFCAAVERPAWRERQFDCALTAEVDALFLSRSRDAWSALLASADCCAEPVLEPHELFAHPQHAGRGLFVESAGLPLLRTQPALVATERLPRARAPRQGEHQAEVLRDYGIAPGGDCG